MIPARHFYMIRHGQTEANEARLMAGSLDSPLTELGRNQARAIHEVVKTLKIKPTRIIHSHLSRARDTATIINEALGVPMGEDRDYAEIHTGKWEGIHYEECPDPLEICTLKDEGEGLQTFLSRVKAAKIRALKAEKEPVLVVSHGGVFRALMRLYDIDLRGVRNCVLYEFEPKTRSESFPWHVWRYDIGSHVARNRVDFENQAADAEIA